MLAYHIHKEPLGMGAFAPPRNLPPWKSQNNYVVPPHFLVDGIAPDHFSERNTDLHIHSAYTYETESVHVLYKHDKYAHVMAAVGRELSL